MTETTRDGTPTAPRWELPVAVGIGILATALAVTGLVLSGERAAAGEWLMGIQTVVGAAVGVVVLRSRPRHPIGRLLIVVAAFDGLIALTTGYVDWAYASESIRPGGVVVRAIREYGWPPLLLAMLSILVRFPTGQPDTRGWARFERVMWGWLALFALTIVTPRAFTDHPRVNGMPNPLGIDALAPMADVVVMVATLPLLLLVAGSVASVIARFRRSRGDERQQLKWLLYFSSPFLLALLIIPTWTQFEASRTAFDALTLAFITGIAVGIRRYRLYDVDRVIRRTVSYAAITGILLGAYGLVVAGLAPLLQPSDGSSDLTVAVATLAVAALFNPVRRRVQAAVDHRFNRARFDAQQIIDAFGERLREEVDLHVLTDELAEVVGETVQPDSVAVWLRGPEVRA